MGHHVLNALTAVRKGQSPWVTLSHEGVAYRLQLAGMRLLATGEPKPWYTLKHREGTYIPVNPSDWPMPLTGWCIAKVNGRARLAQISTDPCGNRFRVNGHLRNDKDILAVAIGGWSGPHRQDTTPCAGTDQPLSRLPAFGGGARCSNCQMWFDQDPGKAAPKHSAMVQWPPRET